MTLSGGKISWAKWKPLGRETEPTITPRVLIFHTMVGNLQGTDSMFRQGGYDGTESTFGVGGPWEGAAFDGELYQWQFTGYQADAQYAGNAYADSVETADGGNPNHPWSSKQLETLINLTVDWCKGTKNPCQLIVHESDHGLGYHAQFHDWNTDGHNCPGPVRLGQLRTIVIPKARAILEGKPAPRVTPAKPPVQHQTGPNLQVDGIFGYNTIRATQHATGATVDGVFGPESRKHLQRHLHVTADGDIGPITMKAWHAFLHARGFWNAPLDGPWNRAFTAAHQKALNALKF